MYRFEGLRKLAARAREAWNHPTDQNLSGRLVRTIRPTRTGKLRKASIDALTAELLARMDEGVFDNNRTVGLGYQLQDSLASALEVYPNRMSRKGYRLFSKLPAELGPKLFPVKGATVIDVGCGSINPYGVAFLFLMLGARRGIAIDCDSIQDESRAIRALADCAATMLLNPAELVGSYPLERSQILANLAGFDLARLQAGDPAGLAHDRLTHLLEPVGRLSLRDGEADMMMSRSFLEHVENADDAVADLARITRNGGIGFHLIDGSDHNRYSKPECHPLQFLTQAPDKTFVAGCNRIRPLDFVPLFERHGFEVVSIFPSQIVDVTPSFQSRMVQPFRSRPPEVLSVVVAEFVVQRRIGQVRSVPVPPPVMAAGWRRPPDET